MRVLVGVPTLNGPDRLDRVLRSIREHTDLQNAVVIVSDDGSTEENLKLNKDAVHTHGVEMLMSDQRLGVPKQWNRLVRHVPSAEICVLLNDDVEVVADWLDVLVFSLDKNPQIGMLSLRCETGVTRASALPRPRVDYHEAKLMDGGGSLVSSGGACFAFRRADWEAVGGFDERYFVFYEECDFGVSLARNLGRSNCIASYPVVYHLGGASTSTLNAAQHLEESRAKFWEKWQARLDDLRAEFAARPQAPKIEWNTSWKVNRHP